VVVVLAALRYGWVPPDQPDSAARSITWLECEHAAGLGRELLVFFADTGQSWPVDRTEAYRLTAAVIEGSFKPELPAEVQRNIEKLKELRTWLETGRTRTTFTPPDDLRAKIIQALYQWLEKHPEFRPEHGPRDPGLPRVAARPDRYHRHPRPRRGRGESPQLPHRATLYTAHRSWCTKRRQALGGGS
jgi:hypothetical protein